RYTGKDRVVEAGLYYQGARYYAPWLGRWTACDPAGLVDGTNLYYYVRGNPIGLLDREGTNSEEVENLKVDLYEAAHEEYKLTAEYEKAHVAEGVAESKVQQHQNKLDHLRDEYRADKFTEDQYARKVTQQEHNLEQAKQNLTKAQEAVRDLKGRGQANADKVKDLYKKADKLGIDATEVEDLRTLARGNAGGYKFGDPPKRPSGKGPGGGTHGGGSSGGGAPGGGKSGKSWLQKAASIGKKIIGSKATKVTLKVVKVVPYVGVAAGAVSAGVALHEERYGDAALDVIGFVPFVGDALDLGRLLASFGPDEPVKPQPEVPRPVPGVTPPTPPPPQATPTKPEPAPVPPALPRPPIPPDLPVS
ncbi:MAG: RHS repeat-associated core domain-containing protein, partial [Pseudonocardiaceae bacterium]